MNKVTQTLLFVFFLIGIAMPFSAPVSAAAATAEQLNQAQAIVSRGERLSSRIGAMKTQAQREKDIIRVNCLNTKLAEVNANLRNAKSRLDSLRSETDPQRVTQAMTVMLVLGQKFQLLDQQANQCIGQNVFETGATKVDTEIGGTNSCTPNPCKNNGTCKVVGSSYSCECSIGFSGKNCEKNDMDVSAPTVLAPAPAPPPAVTAPASKVSIANKGSKEVKENAGTPLSFTITLNPKAPKDFDLTYSISGTGITAADLEGGLSGKLPIKKDATTATIDLKIKGDDVVEADEEFTVTLSPPAPDTGTLDTNKKSASGKILNDDCSNDEYKTAEGACKKISTCTAAQYESKAATATSDRVCSALTACTATQYESKAATATTDRVCSALTACTATQYESKAATATSDRVCSALTACSTTQYESKAAIATTDRVCSALTACTASQYESKAATTTSDRECSTLTACTDSQYESKAATSTSDRICSALTACTDSQYESKAATATTDRVCSALTACTNSQYESKAATATTDRECKAVTTCAADQYQVKAATATSDTICGTPPIAKDDTQTLSADSKSIVVNVLKNDTDPDEDKLTVTKIDKAGVKGFVGLYNGVISYDPNNKFNDVEKGKSITDTFTYTVTDGNSEATAKVTITINGTKEAPLACPDNCSGNGQCNNGQCECNAGYEGDSCAVGSSPSGGSVSSTPAQVDSEGTTTVTARSWNSATGSPLSYNWSATCEGGLGKGSFNDNKAQVEWTAPKNTTGKVHKCKLTAEIEDTGNQSKTTSSTDVEVNFSQTPSTSTKTTSTTTDTKTVKKVMSIKPNKTKYQKGVDTEIIFTVTLSCPDGYPEECSANECAKDGASCPTTSIVCPDNSVKNVAGTCECQSGFYMDKDGSTCKRCPEGADCKQGTTESTMNAKKGFW